MEKDIPAIVSEVREAIDAYEQALMADDVAAMDRFSTLHRRRFDMASAGCLMASTRQGNFGAVVAADMLAHAMRDLYDGTWPAFGMPVGANDHLVVAPDEVKILCIGHARHAFLRCWSRGRKPGRSRLTHSGITPFDSSRSTCSNKARGAGYLSASEEVRADWRLGWTTIPFPYTTISLGMGFVSRFCAPRLEQASIPKPAATNTGASACTRMTLDNPSLLSAHRASPLQAAGVARSRWARR